MDGIIGLSIIAIAVSAKCILILMIAHSSSDAICRTCLPLVRAAKLFLLCFTNVLATID